MMSQNKKKIKKNPKTEHGSDDGLGRGSGREYLMIYGGSGSPPPFHPLPSASCLCFSVFLCVAGRAY